MRIVRDFDAWPRGALHLAIGVFDGVHRGHQELIRRLRDGAHPSGALALATTFDPLPVQVLSPGAPPSTLTDADDRATLLTEAGADAVVLFGFDERFAAMSAREFVDRVLGAGAVRRIVVGPDFRFGHGREGDVALLRAVGRERAVAIDVVSPTLADGAVVSSTRIRDLLVAGDVRGAARLLGRPYHVSGRLVQGDRRGRALGYPTIDVATPSGRLLPRDGIYATHVTIGGTAYMGATTLGIRPAFGGTGRLLVSYLLDATGELRGEDATIAFVERLRDEVRSESPEALMDQVALDVEATRRALRQ